MLMMGLSAFAVEKSQNIVYINGVKYYIHTVQSGETLYSLSKSYSVNEGDIVKSNPLLKSGLKVGDNIKIPYFEVIKSKKKPMSAKKIRKTFDTHFVSKGETLYAISRKYEIPIQTIIADNPKLDPIHLRLGETILIRKKEIGSEDESGSREQWEAYRKTLNSVSEPGQAYHIVNAGETFYSLSHKFGITEEELSQLNGGLRPQDLKAGAMIKVPGNEEEASASEATDSLTAKEDIYGDRNIEEIDFRALPQSQTVNVAVMLPIARENAQPNHNYLEFYQGFLLGLDSVRVQHGCSVNVSLFNTGRDNEEVERIVASDEFRTADIVIGPVYEENLYPVIRFAEQKKIPVVSPLANIEKMNSDVLFQMAPDPDLKYAKISELLTPEREVTLIYTDKTDHKFEQEVLALLGDKPYAKHHYRYEHPNAVAKRVNTVSAADLTGLLSNKKDNMFVIMSDNEIDVDRVLAAIASANTSIVGRGMTEPRFMVLGNARWNRYNNIDRTIFFKDRIVFMSTYHAKRDAQMVLDFDKAYIRSFKNLPTLYSYRGYDAAMIFVPAMYNDIEYDMEGRKYTPLQTTYRFGQGEGRHNHVNRNWSKVTYNTDYTITVD